MAEPPRKPFELEPEEPRVPAPPRPAARAEVPSLPAAPPRDESGIDTRTFAEKRGEAVARVAGTRPPPPDWPREALRFPLGGAGIALLLSASGGVFVLDLIGWMPALRILTWILKVPVLLFLLRWQLDLAGMTAGGRDTPVGFTRAFAVDREGMGAAGRLIVWLCITMLPGRVFWLLGPSVLGVIGDSGGLEVGLSILGSVWLAAVAVGMAVGEPRLSRPWITIAWILRRPLALLAGSVGWWALGSTEAALAALAGDGNWATLPAGAVLRVISVYLVMVSARALGVVGRSV